MTTTAIVTGAGTGFGLALTRALAGRGATVIAGARDAARLRTAAADLPGVRPVPGDVNDPAVRAALVAAAGDRIDLLVHNAGELGPSPLPPLSAYPADALRAVLETTLLAPLQLTQLALPALRAAGGTVVTLGYGAAKAALDQYAAVLGVEEPELAVYAFDPGDMRTAMHQRAFPGEDISDRPEPETVVPAFLRLVDERRASGRYRAADLVVPA